MVCYEKMGMQELLNYNEPNLSQIKQKLFSLPDPTDPELIKNLEGMQNSWTSINMP
jgi:hypothetical protein